MEEDHTPQPIITPLATRLKERIKKNGPITVHDYMQACLYDIDYGYYRNSPALGSGQDFITSPEISQVFGELVGLWAGVVWQKMGAPEHIDLVEVGPGRGTLMRDALRAAKILPDFIAAANVNLIEVNKSLTQIQRATLNNLETPLHTYESLTSYISHRASKEAPTIILANEFLDCLPIRQFTVSNGVLLERHVCLNGIGEFAFMLPVNSQSNDLDRPSHILEGQIVEFCPSLASEVIEPLRHLSSSTPVAALFIDYGDLRGSIGDSFQAIHRHHKVSPFYAQGETDLTCHVNFGYLRDLATVPTGPYPALLSDGPITQGEFLGRLGILERASRLISANPSRASEIETAINRLVSPTGMGGSFKAIALRSSELPPLPGFPFAPDNA